MSQETSQHGQPTLTQVQPLTHTQPQPHLTGAQIIMRCLAEENVEFVFGYPGGAVLNI